MLPKVTFKANFTRRKSNITELNCRVDGLPDPIRSWFKYAVSVTAPVYWAVSSGQPGAKNGLEVTHGYFNFSTRIIYPNGEVLFIDHTGQGVNDNGEMVMDVKMKGATPKFPSKASPSFRDFKDMFVITGNGQMSSTGQRYFTVDDKTFQYLCNSTVQYKPATQAPNSFSQTVEVMDVDINERPGGIEYAVKTYTKTSMYCAWHIDNGYQNIARSICIQEPLRDISHRNIHHRFLDTREPLIALRIEDGTLGNYKRVTLFVCHKSLAFVSFLHNHYQNIAKGRSINMLCDNRSIS